MNYELKVETYSIRHPGYYVIKYRRAWRVFGLKIPFSWEVLTYSLCINSLGYPPKRDQPVFFHSIETAVSFVKDVLDNGAKLDEYIERQDALHKRNIKRYYESMPKIQTHYTREI